MFDLIKMFLLCMAIIMIISFLCGLIAFAIDIIRYKSTFDGALKREDLLERLMYGEQEQLESESVAEPVSEPPRKEFEIDVG